MMRMFAVSLLVLAVAAGQAAQAETPRPITLAEALDLASRQNPELGAARERARGAGERGQAAGRAAWPRLVAGAEWGRSDNPARVFMWKLNRGELTAQDFAIDRLNDPDAISHLSASAALEAPLDIFGKLRAPARSAAASGRAAAAQAEEMAQRVRLAVVEAYCRSSLAEASLAATARALEGARAREADSEARVAEGAALQAELLRARTRRRQREANRAEREAERYAARAGLSRVLGTPDVVYEAAGAAGPAPATEGDGDSWIEKAKTGRGLVRIAREALTGAEWSERAERRSLLPDLSLYGQVQDDRGGFSQGRASSSLGVLLRWSAFDPSRRRRLAAAGADRTAAAEDLRAAEDQVRFDVEVAWHRLLAARERFTAAAGGAVDGREALRVVQERRRAGMATLTDELETEAESLAAELEEMRAAAEAAIADAALRRAAGAL